MESQSDAVRVGEHGAIRFITRGDPLWRWSTILEGGGQLVGGLFTHLIKSWSACFIIILAGTNGPAPNAWV